MVEFSNVFEDERHKKKDTDSQKKQENGKLPSKEDQPAKDKEENSSAHSIEFSAIFEMIKPRVSEHGESQDIVMPLKADKEAQQPAVHSEPEQIDNLADMQVSVGEMYGNAVSLAQRIFTADVTLTESEIHEILEFVKYLINYVKEGSQELIKYVFEKDIFKTADYYALNSLNVCILALEIGVGLGYDYEHLLRLGFAAFLHGIGMTSMSDMIRKRRKLTPQEKKQLEQHPLIASDMLRRIHDSLADSAVEVIEQSYERVNGSGYPRGLKGKEISEDAQIIGLVDVYEALTHHRPYREKLSTLEALKIIFNDKELFNPKLTKVFIERIGLYPKGTFVELNTKEVAQVIRQNLDMPSCPIVCVAYAPDGQKVEKGRQINLSEGTEVYITRSL